jgi:hypothetical protein
VVLQNVPPVVEFQVDTTPVAVYPRSNITHYEAQPINKYDVTVTPLRPVPSPGVMTVTFDRDFRRDELVTVRGRTTLPEVPCEVVMNQCSAIYQRLDRPLIFTCPSEVLLRLSVLALYQSNNLAVVSRVLLRPSTYNTQSKRASWFFRTASFWVLQVQRETQNFYPSVRPISRYAHIASCVRV